LEPSSQNIKLSDYPGKWFGIDFVDKI